jgi:hypothetical protein
MLETARWFDLRSYQLQTDWKLQSILFTRMLAEFWLPIILKPFGEQFLQLLMNSQIIKNHGVENETAAEVQHFIEIMFHQLILLKEWIPQTRDPNFLQKILKKVLFVDKTGNITQGVWVFSDCILEENKIPYFMFRYGDFPNAYPYFSQTSPQALEGYSCIKNSPSGLWFLIHQNLKDWLNIKLPNPGQIRHRILDDDIDMALSDITDDSEEDFDDIYIYNGSGIYFFDDIND